MGEDFKPKREVMDGVIREEYNRLGDMEKFYIAEIEKLPKGSIQKRIIGNKAYYYLKFRDDQTGAVKSVYVKPERVSELSRQIQERKRMKNLLKQIQMDREILGKVLR